MSDELKVQKAALRKQIRAGLKNVSAEDLAADSAGIRARLQQQAFWQKAGAILFFAPMPDEVDVWPLLTETLAAGKSAALPRYDAVNNDYLACRVQHPQTEIAPGHFGIREPNPSCPEIPIERLELILVPGVAFDLRGHRLGRGRGFYDRLLANTSVMKCGVTLDQQVVETVPTSARDVRMDFILTPTRCVKCDG